MPSERVELIFKVLTEGLSESDRNRARKFFLIIARLGRGMNLTMALIQRVAWPVGRRMISLGWPMSMSTAKKAIRIARRTSIKLENAATDEEQDEILFDSVPPFRSLMISDAYKRDKKFLLFAETRNKVRIRYWWLPERRRFLYSFRSPLSQKLIGGHDGKWESTVKRAHFSVSGY